jgi:hypothetical protein
MSCARRMTCTLVSGSVWVEGETPRYARRSNRSDWFGSVVLVCNIKTFIPMDSMAVPYSILDRHAN